MPAAENYLYDRFGNRWQQNGPYSFVTTFTGNATANNNRMDLYSYDSAGNLLNDGVHGYTYDAENHVTQVDGGATATYVYDATGRRVRKTVSGSSFDYLYDLAGNQVAILNSSGGWLRGEVYAGGKHLATYYNGTTYFIHSDWLGTERVRSSLAGAPCETISSLPFGDGLTTSGSCSDLSPLLFTGKERDNETGLDNFGARFNDSSFGRFMSPDPEGAGASPVAPQSWNAYAYVLNNPLNLIDPNGLDCVYAADADGNPNSGSLTVVHGDCLNEGGKDDGGVFVDNDPRDPVNNSNVSLSDDGTVGVVSFTRADGLGTGYACVGSCPPNPNTVQVTATPLDAPVMSAYPFSAIFGPPPPNLTVTQPATFWGRFIVAAGCTVGLDAENMAHQPEPNSGNDGPTASKLTEGKFEARIKGKPGKPPEMNRSGARSAEVMNNGAEGVGLVGNQQACLQNASGQR
ncbi:MAG TPA: RHS repeat-associated core domain-containing protein [Candidatus Acidoferrum sp.]|nr:RHS repeat-associated core domain-containing protein [Candidatus Acidoferrum sp.]